MSIADEFPLADDEEGRPQPESQPSPNTPTSPDVNSTGWQALPNRLREAGKAGPVLRYGTHALALALVLAVLLGLRYYYAQAGEAFVELPERSAQAASVSSAAVIVGAFEAAGSQVDTLLQVNLPGWQTDPGALDGGIPRYAVLHTTIPSRARVDVITYTVQAGDTVFGIASNFGLNPETIFWGNRETLNDNPHSLREGMVLNILPIDGTYHKWTEGENLRRVAEFYGVDPLTVVEYPGNRLDAYTFNLDTPNLEAGSFLIIPGGRREFIDWGPPRITRTNPAVARTYGPGFCGSIADGAVGNGTFIWPTTATYLSGYDFNPAANHPGIDIAGSTGNAIYAVDAGVVVYAGWSDYGYGFLVVLDHGNGWQSLYAHLSSYYVECGQSVFQGTNIAALGSTGNSTGPHLHFELMYGTVKVNPWNYMSP